MRYLRSILICVIAVTEPGLLAAQAKSPVIVFDSLTKDFGSVTEGQVVKHVFKFKNNGQGLLEILKTEPQCGCTAAILSSNMLKPGETGEIEVSVKTEGMGGMTMGKSVTVMNNDPRQSQLILTINAKVEQEFIFSENSLYFGSVPRGKDVTKELTITIPDGRDAKLLSVESTDPNVTAKLEASSGGSGRVFKIVATQKSSTPEGYHNGLLKIKTSSAHRPELQIGIRGMITGGQNN